MTEEKWEACSEWRELYSAVPSNERQLLLWVAGVAELAVTEDTDPRTVEAVRSTADAADTMDRVTTWWLCEQRSKAYYLARSAGRDSRYSDPLDVAVELATRSGHRSQQDWFADVADAIDALATVSPCVVEVLRDIFGNPFRPVAFDPRWRSESAVALARTAYDTRNFSLLPILADALEEAGCDHPDILSHCRGANGVHVRGCWVVDGVLGKQ